MASHSKGRKLDVAKKGGEIGAIVPPQKPVNTFPLMSYLSRNCSFSDDEESKDLFDEEVLKAENDRRTEELLSQAAQVPLQSTDSSDDERKKALEVLHSLEFARNQEDTWKFSRPASKTEPNYGGFLHPLRRNDKEDEYFSGTRKAKQPRERKRSRSEEVVLIEEGKLISKTGEPSQLPIRFTHPSSSPRPRVPSVGLPFTPAPPPPVEKSVWYQKSGAELFSEVQSKTLVAYGVNCDEDEALALVLAESIRTAKEEEKRMINIREMYKMQCALLPSSSKLSPDPPAPVRNDNFGPQACSALSKDDKTTGAIKMEEKKNGNKTGFTLLERALDSARKSVNHEIDVTKGSSHMPGDGLQQRSRYDHERNAKLLRSSQSGSHLNNSCDKKSLQGAFECKDEINYGMHPQSTMKSSETEVAKLHVGPIPQKTESRGKLTTSSINHLEQQDSCHNEQKSPLSDPVTRVTSMKETCSKELLSSESTSNEALYKNPVKVTNDLHKSESSSGYQPLSKHLSQMESTQIIHSGNIPKRCEYGDLRSDQHGIGNACSRSTRLSRGTLNDVSLKIQSEGGGETITSSSSRLPSSKSALMSAMKAYISTDPTMTVSHHNSSVMPQYGLNQKPSDDQIGKSENVTSSFYSSSESTRAFDENMNETKEQQLHAGSVVPDVPKNKTSFDVSSSLDQNSNKIQMLSMQQTLGSKPSVSQDRQSKVNASCIVEPNQNERSYMIQAPAVNPCNSPHSSAASVPGPSPNTVLPSCVLGDANVSTNGLSAHSIPMTGSHVKLLTPQAPSSSSNLLHSNASTDPPVSSNTQASATSTCMPVSLTSRVSENPYNVMGLPSSVPGIFNMLPSAHGLPGFHAACFPGAPMGSSMKQPDNKNLFTPVPSGVSGMPGMPSSLLGAFSGLQNVLPGIPGLTNSMPGISNILPGGLSGLPPNLYSGLPTLENSFTKSTLGSQKPLEMQGSQSLSMQGVQGHMPPLNTFPIDPYFASMQILSGGLPFSDTTNAPLAAPVRSSCNSGLTSPQPGNSPLVHGKGRGRLAKGSYPA